MVNPLDPRGAAARPQRAPGRDGQQGMARPGEGPLGDWRAANGQRGQVHGRHGHHGPRHRHGHQADQGLPAARGEQARVGLEALQLPPAPPQPTQAAAPDPHGLEGLVAEIKALLAEIQGGAPAAARLTAQQAAPAGAGPTPAAIDPNQLPDNPSWSQVVQALEAQFGPVQWKEKHGKNKRDVLLNSSDPAFSTKAWGPNTTRILREAYQSLQSGDYSKAKELYSSGASTSSPVMLDLNHDGKLGTTGVSTAKQRADGQVGRTVAFDIDGDGKQDRIEWMDGAGDGMLVDDRDGQAASHMDGTRLFGDQGGTYANGYDKLAKLDADHDGQLTGHELDGLKVWVDDGDARVGAGELKTLAELGVTQLDVGMHTERNARGETLMRSGFTQDGQRRASEDVWFAHGS